MNNLTIDDILRGTELGQVQSVGHMQVVPLLGRSDDRYAPPELEVETTAYGTVVLRNRDARPTIVPPGAGWVVKQSAQDHALGGGALLGANQQATIATARCIQSSQCGMIRAAKHPMLVLPAALRPHALATRKEVGYNKLWDAIAKFNGTHGVRANGHLEYFLRQFKEQLGRFVAEFELVPDQVGAIVLVGGRVAGIERAPSTAFWRVLWEPLIRVCYGSLAVARARETALPPDTRVPMRPGAQSIRELRERLLEAEGATTGRVLEELESLRPHGLRVAGDVDQRLGQERLQTVASRQLAGQVVARERGEIAYVSVSTTSVEGFDAPVVAATSAEPVEPAAEIRIESEDSGEAQVGVEQAGWYARAIRWLFGS